jgi:hypothetical protein
MKCYEEVKIWVLYLKVSTISQVLKEILSRDINMGKSFRER